MARYAVLKIGNQQYRVQENDVLDVQRLSLGTGIPAEAGQNQEIELGQVLVLGGDGEARIGQPYLEKSSVVCEVLGEEKQAKTISFKIKRRKGYRRKMGHRQTLLRLHVKKITGE